LFGFPTCDIPQPKDKKIILKDILESGYPVQVENFGKTINFTQTKSCSLCARDWKGFGNQQMTAVLEPLKVGYIGNVDAQSSRVYSIEGKSATLNALGGGGGAKTGLYKIDLPDGKYIIRKLSPIECERLQTLPDNYTEGVSNTQRYKCIGNGWTIDVITHILSFMEVVA
jgi:site-specific DNA-cytosine methylase